MKHEIYRLPSELEQSLFTLLQAQGYTSRDKDLSMLAALVQKLSNRYTSGQPIGDIWSQPSLSLAYLSYFLPLNFLRMQNILAEANGLGFLQGIESVVDIGAGPGTTSLAFQYHDWPNLPFVCVEQGGQAKAWYERLLKANPLNSTPEQQPQWVTTTPSHWTDPQSTLLCMSYSLNEMKELPKWNKPPEAILILEPSTSEDSRRLLQLRQNLLDEGYYAWAPCTHQAGCPMLLDSNKDWCHTRIFIEMPEWWRKMESHLSMENRSITYSYLLMRKTPPKTGARQARVIGDTLREKGKTRQMICRGPKREFLAWLKRHGPAQPYPRGARITLPMDLEEKSNELRVNTL
jgi:ribosomal protein RSM22 (predicted rRNA methylase)